MSQLLGEVKLLPYDDVSEGFLMYYGQALHINFQNFICSLALSLVKMATSNLTLPDLTENAPKDMTYCIAIDGEVRKIHGGRG